MNEQVQAYIEQFPAEVAETFKALRRLIYDSTDADLVEILGPNFRAIMRETLL